jgi:hypothetical protein
MIGDDYNVLVNPGLPSLQCACDGYNPVPKAGGTALARTLKKVICKINPALAAYNPCCRKNLCLHSSSCHAVGLTTTCVLLALTFPSVASL